MVNTPVKTTSSAVTYVIAYSITGESLGTGDGTTTSFSGTLLHYPVKPSTTTFHYTIPYSVTGENLGTGDGSTTSFSGTLVHHPVKASTVAIHYTISSTAYTATDDGNGNISGTECTGTINYDTGAWSLTFNIAPDDTTDITADYDYQTTYTATDDGNGNISGTECTGTINYDTGAWSLTFNIAPDDGTSIMVDYQWYNTILQVQIKYGSDYSSPVTVDQKYLIESTVVVYENGSEISSDNYTLNADDGLITINLISTDTVTVDYYRYYGVVFTEDNIEMEMFKWRLYTIGITLEEDI